MSDFLMLSQSSQACNDSNARIAQLVTDRKDDEEIAQINQLKKVALYQAEITELKRQVQSMVSTQFDFSARDKKKEENNQLKDKLALSNAEILQLKKQVLSMKNKLQAPLFANLADFKDMKLEDLEKSQVLEYQLDNAQKEITKLQKRLETKNKHDKYVADLLKR